MLGYNWVENCRFAGRPAEGDFFVSHSVCILEENSNKKCKEKINSFVRGNGSFVGELGDRGWGNH